MADQNSAAKESSAAEPQRLTRREQQEEAFIKSLLERVGSAMDKRLTAYDEKVSKREDDKMHKVLDDIIAGASKPASGPSQAQGQPQRKEGISEYIQIAREMGILGGESSGTYGPMEQRMASILSRGYENWLRAQEREFARKLGIPTHEEAGEHA